MWRYYFFLKYINFGIHTISAAASFFGAGRDILSGFNWLVPLGISYYSLSLMGYVVDLYFGIAVPQKKSNEAGFVQDVFPVMNCQGLFYVTEGWGTVL